MRIEEALRLIKDLSLEQAEIDAKVFLCRNAIEHYNEISDEQKRLMSMQVDFMNKVSDVLRMRINNIKEGLS